MAKSITRIDVKKLDLLQRKRVAAYARVSMDTERLMHSLSVQVSYYSELIQNTPGWEYAGVYADEGISGTKMDSRPEFIRMLADCEAGKIDIILTKSLSRFARNTVDTLNVVRRLKELGIEVRFEKERNATLRRKTSGPSTARASCSLPSCHHWHRRKAAPSVKTAPGVSVSAWQTARFRFPSAASWATIAGRTVSWW